MGLMDKLGRSKKAQPVTDQIDAPQMGGASDMRAAYASGGYRADSYYDEPSVGEMTVGDYANGVPNIRLSELFKSLFRQLPWMIILFVIGAIGIWYATKDLKRTYSGEGTIMVQLGDEYVYQPVQGSSGQSSLLQTPDTITLNEIAIIKNAEVMDRVIGEMMSQPGGLERFDDDIAKKLKRAAPNSVDYQLAYMELRKKMDRDFYVAARPKSSIIDMSYKHENPQLAVVTLNALMDAYMSYRRTVFVEGTGDLIAQRRRDTEEQLAQNERKIAGFLAKNGISDFDSEQGGARKRTEDLKAELNTLRAQIAETERSLAVVEDQLRATPKEINLYVDDRTSNRIAQAELELKSLLATYLPTSDPVRRKQAEINELRSLQRANGGQAAGGRRVGPNPVQQDLVRRANTLRASADSFREKEFTLQRQLNSVDGKLRRMTKLSPEYNDLLRERDALTNRLTSYLTKEQEAVINQQQAESSAENVRVISHATYPVKGRNMQKLALAMGCLFWAFTVFMLALFKVFADPRLYRAPPSPRAAMPRQPIMPAADYADIPEPVQPYSPATSAPETMPDEFRPAAEGDWGAAPAAVQPAPWQAQEWVDPSLAPAQDQAYADAQGYYAAAGYDPVTGQPYAATAYQPGQEWVDPNAATGTHGAAQWTDPAQAQPQTTNPYLSGAPAGQIG